MLPLERALRLERRRFRRTEQTVESLRVDYFRELCIEADMSSDGLRQSLRQAAHEDDEPRPTNPERARQHEGGAIPEERRDHERIEIVGACMGKRIRARSRERHRVAELHEL
jgi:hypothetical protein